MRRPSGPAIAVIVLALVVGLPAFYALSIGPAYWLSTHDYLDQSWLPAIYAPIGRANQRDDCRLLVYRYVALWDESIWERSVDPFGPET